jgi:hypothetical protein
MDFQAVAAVTIVGLVGSTAIFHLTQRLGSDDPFAIELVFWWLATDLLLTSKLKNWKLCFSRETVRQNQESITAGLIWLGILLLVLTIVLTLRTNGGRYTIWDAGEWWTDIRIIRANLARSLAGMYTSLHLALFLT